MSTAVRLRGWAILIGIWSAVGLTLYDGPRVEQAPGFLEARGAFFTHRPMPFVVTLGRVAPGADLVGLGSAWPEVFGPDLGPVWLSEALLGLARASEVEWLEWTDDGLPLEFGSFETPRLVWDGREPLFGRVRLYLSATPSGTIVFFRDEAKNMTTFVDLELLDSIDARIALEVARGTEQP